jgi:hypothetical protein
MMRCLTGELVWQTLSCYLATMRPKSLPSSYHSVQSEIFVSLYSVSVHFSSKLMRPTSQIAGRTCKLATPLRCQPRVLPLLTVLSDEEAKVD